ncbi:hypothetical protein [Meiothermus sp. Pnk-1]|uniref:hypothetical protein n=1 Tax=Meiothermus sp. Pnk-1 TaxID=873128 RepID=UPI000D7CBE98|nr:hypothetical protein [Meiothermus sp. Pnk-1]PZA08312.1 hypothetical protein DNA98_04025 [Meiothermus sp. Pnk-1]
MNPLTPLASFGGYQGPLAGMFPGQLATVDQWQQFMKAVQTAGDPHALDFKAGLTGVPAIRPESLETLLRSIVVRKKEFKLFNRLKSKNTGSSITEWATLSGLGRDIGSSFHGEMSTIRGGIPQYNRGVLRIKYLMERTGISMVAAQQETIVNDLKAQHNEAATLSLLSTVEWGLFNGDESVNPYEYDGIKATLEKQRPQNIFDLNGSSDTEELFQKIMEASSKAVGFAGGFNRITDAFVSNALQLDLNNHLAPQWRVSLDRNNPVAISYGAPVEAIKTGFGDGVVALNQDQFIEFGDADYLTTPIGVRLALQDLSIPASAPTYPTLAVTAVGPTPLPSGIVSRFNTADRAGTYYYAVACIGEGGEGPISGIEAVTIPQGGIAQLTITPPAQGSITGYVVYRSKRNPVFFPQPSDLRKVKRIPADGASPVTFYDANEDIPGTTDVYLLNLEDEATLAWRQLMDLTTFPLYPTDQAIYPWAVLMFGAPLVGIPRSHFVVKGYLPKTAAWKPF